MRISMKSRIEGALENAINRATRETGPPRLAAALIHAVFPAGARIRPTLCLAVADACGNAPQATADATAAAIELLHCASLVHDDLPCFDDADFRRGAPSVHRAYGEPLAVLAGDALIVMAFETLAQGFAAAPVQLPPVMLTIAQSVGMPCGIVAGQAWECEPDPDLTLYHRTKTGALFVAATMAGAAVAGCDPKAWRAVGERLGEAYQVADDIRDVVDCPIKLGKPVGRDETLGRPSAVRAFGLEGALRKLEGLMTAAIEGVPRCSGADELRALLAAQTRRFVPQPVAERYASLVTA